MFKDHQSTPDVVIVRAGPVGFAVAPEHEHSDPRGGFASRLGERIFAIGYGIPPTGALQAIQLATTPVTGQVAASLARK